MLYLVNQEAVYDTSDINNPVLNYEVFTAVNKFYLFFTIRDVLNNQKERVTFFHYSNPVVSLNNNSRLFSLKHGYIIHEMDVIKEEYVKDHLDTECLCELASYKNNYTSFFSRVPNSNNKNTYLILHKKRMSASKVNYIKEKCIVTSIDQTNGEEIIENDSVVMLLAEIQKPDTNQFVILKVFNENGTDEETAQVRDILYSESSEFILNFPYNLVIMDEYTY